MAGTKVDGKAINMESSTSGKLRHGTTRITKDGEVTLNGDILLPEKKLFIDESTSVGLPSLDKGLIENKRVDDYNESLFAEHDPIVDNMILIGPKLMVRLFRLKMYNPDGIWTGGRTQEIISESEMKKKKVQLNENMQYQERGVVVKVSDDCSENVKNKIKPGLVIDLDPVAFNPGRMQRWLHKDNVNNQFDNYFIIPEFIVENILLNK